MLSLLARRLRAAAAKVIGDISERCPGADPNGLQEHEPVPWALTDDGGSKVLILKTQCHLCGKMLWKRYPLDLRTALRRWPN